MKHLTITLVLLSSMYITHAQEKSFTLGIGFFGACPQFELDDTGYDDGYGMNLDFLSRPYPIGVSSSWQVGTRLDIAAMDSRKYGTVQLNTPTTDLGEIKVSNSMIGFFGQLRYNIGDGRLQPYVDALVGFRAFNTKQTLTAMRPELNPEYESSTLYDKVVYTDRFAYGGSIGLKYQLTKYVYLESAITYTEGGRGAVMPLKDVYREGDFMRYPHVFSETDMLLINLGVRFQLFRIQTGGGSGGGSSSPSSRPYSPKSTPDYDNSDPPDSNPDPPKKKLEVKPPTTPRQGGSKA